MYPPEIIEEVRYGNDIVDVVSSYVTLKHNGSNYFGLCPFHREKSPSFSVSADKQMYYCFGCGAAGNVYSFVMQIENYSFIDALKLLAERIRYTLPEPKYSEEAKRATRTRELLLEMHKKTARFFYDNLSSPEGSGAAAYLDKRRVNPKLRIKFGLGYCPQKRDSLYKYLLNEGYEAADIAKSGLVIDDKRGGFYDRFSGRLMFPIFTAQGAVVGFGGRALVDSGPKYLNSSDSPIFDKSKNLYGINLARQSRQKEFILVEGYMDVISLHQAGFTNAVAALGTAFNDEHTRLLKKFCEGVTILFDSDEAGTNAALRAIPILYRSGLKTKVLQVKDAKDPDEYITNFGSEAFAKLLTQAESHVMFEINILRRSYDLHNPEDKIKFTSEAAKVLSRLASEVEKETYIKEIARLTDISQEAVVGEVRKNTATQKPVSLRQSSYAQPAYSGLAPKSDKGLSDAIQTVLHIMTINSAVSTKLMEYLQPSEIPDSCYAKLLMLLYDYTQNKRTIYPAEILNYFDTPDEQKKISGIFNIPNKYEDSKEIQASVNDSLRLIKKTSIDDKIRAETDMASLKNLVEIKRNLESLNITIPDG